MYHGDRMGSHFSSLDQINSSNVRKLEVAWTYRCEPVQGGTTIECNPIVVGERIYLTTPVLTVVCLEAATGKPVWKWNPLEFGGSRGVNRGLTWWQSDDAREKRLFVVSGFFLFCLDPESGRLIESFGDQGRVDLRENLDRDIIGLFVTSTSPGIIFDDLIILGSRVGEGPAPAAPGHIRGFDVRTGKRRWIFHTIPKPGERGYETWPPNAWMTAGGANAWGGLTLDPRRKLVFFGTGSAAYDHYGGNREGANLFANCVVALRADTGAYAWHFQTVHHDLWDYDLPCPPVLVTVNHGGQSIDAAAQVTKVGHLFLLNRETGQPLFPVEERPVPPSELPGEHSWPTQPFPVKPPPYAQQRFTAAEAAEISAESREAIREKLTGMVTGEVFLPPGLKPSVALPQFNGGAEWGGPAFDPDSRTLFVNASNEAEWISMEPSQPRESMTSYDLGARIYRSTCAHCHGNTEIQAAFGDTPPPSLKDVARRLKRAEVETMVKSGKGAMPAHGVLAAAEQKAVVDFLFDAGKKTTVDPALLKASWKEQIPYVDTGHHEFRDAEGYPVNRRPWGTLTAIDLNEGRFRWQVPLGTYPALEKRGFPPTGTFNIGGPIATAGGLVFIGATMDERFRAFDAKTGETLWEFQLDAGAYATPATYLAGGRQYVLVAAGGGGKPGTKSGNQYYAFALPR